MTTDISNSQDVLDVRDIIARIEELEEAKEAFEEQITEWQWEKEELEKDTEENQLSEILEIVEKIKNWGTWEESDEGIELKQLTDFLGDFCGYGGDEQWRGDWYPATLIRDDYFEDYAEELCKDIGYISNDFPSWIEIDWKATAENVQQDYASGEFDGVTYWGR